MKRILLSIVLSLAAVAASAQTLPTAVVSISPPSGPSAAVTSSPS